jgi:hypothetical protein
VVAMSIVRLGKKTSNLLVPKYSSHTTVQTLQSHNVPKRAISLGSVFNKEKALGATDGQVNLKIVGGCPIASDKNAGLYFIFIS